MNHASRSRGWTPGNARQRVGLSVSTSLLLVILPLTVSAIELIDAGGFVPNHTASEWTFDMPAADFDGDGLADLAVLGTQIYSDVIRIAGVQAGTGWTFKQSIIAASSNDFYGRRHLRTWVGPDGPHLLYQRGNVVSDYAGWPLQLANQWDLVPDTAITDAAIADVDGDGVDELVATESYPGPFVEAFSLETGAPLWQVSGSMDNEPQLHVAQLDADPALELIVSGYPGTIVDGATHAIEWQYKDGFGRFIEHGRFGGATPRFISASSRISMFQSMPWSPLWDTDDIDIYATSVADIDGDEVDEFMYSTVGSLGGIHIFDVSTQSDRKTFPFNKAGQLAVGEFDGSPGKDIALGRYESNPEFDASFRVIDSTTSAIEFESDLTAPGPYVVGGFLEDSGRIDVVVGSQNADDIPGAISRRVAGSGTLLWQTPVATSVRDITNVQNLLVTQLAGSAHPVVIARGYRQNESRSNIVALDANDGSPLWDISSADGVLPDGRLYGLVAIDADGDQLTDGLATCSSDSRIRQYDVSTRLQIWQSVAMTRSCVGAMQVDVGSGNQIVAVLTGGLRAYDVQTHLLSWSLPSPYTLTGAAYVPNGDSGPELALLDEGGITFYDAESRAELRRISPGGLLWPWSVTQSPGASIRELVITGGDRMGIVDGLTGEVRAISGPLGDRPGLRNQVATLDASDGSILLASGSAVAVAIHRLDGLSDSIFSDGFEAAFRQ